MTNTELYESVQQLSNRQRKEIYLETERMAKDFQLRIGDSQLPFIRIPYIIDKDKINVSIKKLDILIAALVKMEEYALSSEGTKLYDRLVQSLTPGGRELVKQCKFEQHSSLLRRHRRVDAYYNTNTNGFSVIEVNQAAPLAIHFHDVIQRISDYMFENLGLEAPNKRLAPYLLNWFIKEYQNRTNSVSFPENIALVIEHGYPPKFTDLPNMAKSISNYCQEIYNENLNIITCFPYDLRLKNGELYYNNTKIDLVWRNTVYMDSYKKDNLPIDDYLKACNNHKDHIILNATRVWLTRNKETFTILSDDEWCAEIGLLPEEISTLREIVPESINLLYNPDRKEEILKNRAEWISKPSDAGFGNGVEFGSNHKLESWGRIVDERSSNTGYIFQKRISYPVKQVIDIADNGEIVEFDIEFDLCPHHINGEFTGTALSRANILESKSASKKMNLVSGGYLLPIEMI